MVGSSLRHAMTETVNEFVVLKSPARDGKEGRGGLGDETFEDKVRTEAFEKVNDEVNVFVGREKVKIGRILLVFLRHTSSSDELELMEFEQGERKGGEDVSLSKNGFPILPRKS